MGRRCLCVRRGAGGKLKLLVQQRAPRGAELSLQGDRFGSPGRVVRRRGTFWGQAEDISSLERNPCAIPVCTHFTVTGWHGRVPAQHVLLHHTFSLLSQAAWGWLRYHRAVPCSASPRAGGLAEESRCLLEMHFAFLRVVSIGRSGTAAQRLCLTSLTCKLRQMWRKSFSLFQPLPNSVAIFRLAVRAEKGFPEEEMRCLISCGVRSKERPT